MAAADVLCPHCKSKQKVPEHRLTESVICLSCQQTIVEPWQYKIRSDTGMELAIKLKGRLVSEFGTTKLDEVKSKADDYTGHFDPVDDEEEFADDTGTKTRTKTQTDLPQSRGATTLMLESGMYAALPSKARLSTAAKTYIIAGVVIALLTAGVVTLGVMLLDDGDQKTSEIHASGAEGERVETYPNGSVKAKWNVAVIDGLEQQHGPYQEFYVGGKQKVLGSYAEGLRVGTWTSWHENGRKESEVAYKDGKEDGTWTAWHSNGKEAGKGEYIDGKKDGEWRTWHRDGRMASSSRFENGKPIGEWVEWHPDGERKSQGQHKDGFKEGRWIYLRDNGSIELEENWTRGVLNGESYGQHRDRGDAFRGDWDKGLRQGVWTWWHINGRMQKRGEYADGKEIGPWNSWHPNGQVRETGRYEAGRKQGTWEEYDEDGELVARREYANDMIANEQHYYRGTEVQLRTRTDGAVLISQWTVLAGDGGDVKHGYEHSFHPNGERAESGAWVNGKRDGLWRTWNEQGDLKKATNWKDGAEVD